MTNHDSTRPTHLRWSISQLHTEPDWDAVSEIAWSLNTLPLKKILHLIKGHQDDKIAHITPTPKARLNVDADVEAGDYWLNNPGPQPKVPRLVTTNVAQLHIRGITISAPYRTKIGKAASTMNLQHTSRKIQMVGRQQPWQMSTL
jgi:hypothetical protein